MIDFKKASGPMALKLLPFTPVPFTTDPATAYLRIAIYGTLMYATWRHARKVSYAFAGAASLSLLTSLTSEIVKNSSTGEKYVVNPGEKYVAPVNTIPFAPVGEENG